FGQIVILILMQLGGLGIMIFGGIFGLLLGRNITLRETMALQDAISRDTIGQIGSLVKFIVASTFALEAIGAVFLYPMWDVSVAGPARCLYLSVFHAVSAFCNAGFALQPDSLIAYRTAWQVYAVVMPLIVLGGIGFPAAHDMYTVAGNRLRYWRARRRYVRGDARRPVRPNHMGLSLHSRIVLVTSAILIVVGAALLFVAETPLPISSRHAPPAEGAVPAPPHLDSMVGMSRGHRIGAALFQSVTARTAGFNTVRTDEESMSPGSHFLLCVLMFIGGSPASTAGGVKTVAVAVLVLAVVARLRRRENVEVFARTIDDEYVARASTLIIGMFALATLVTITLALTENASLREVMFESVSACGTVGLSTGLTPRLTVPGKVVIILAMFAGRVGPLTFLIALAGKTRSPRYEYPTEAVIIG
ncbi:MAG: TrkH family potassium uptake protein, partial [Phycisphaerales bacterium]